MAFNLSTILSTSTSENKKQYRRIFVGPTTETWIVPEGTYEVEVNVFGGGGNGGNAATGTVAPNPFTPSGFYQVGGTGGGGGGFARHLYKVNPGDVLSIVVGGRGGTSSVNVPTQAPTLPISATGGSSGFPGGGEGGIGGNGSVAAIPVPVRSGITTSYRGGNGSNNVGAPNYYFTSGAGGGASGFINGNGQNGFPGKSFAYPFPSPQSPFNGVEGGIGGSIQGVFSSDSPSSSRSYADYYPVTLTGQSYDKGWFYLEDIFYSPFVELPRSSGDFTETPKSSYGGFPDQYFVGKSTPGYSSRTFAGSNGTGVSPGSGSLDAPLQYSIRNNLFCGGGGGGGWYFTPGSFSVDPKTPRIGYLGGVGLVIIYW